MTEVGDGLAVLRSEIAAFYAGFGQPDLLRQACDDAVLLVPLTGDGQLYTSRVRGIDWICAFTGEYEYARYMVARGVLPEETYRYQRLLGSRLVAWAAARPEPTGVSIDCVGDQPVAFPPRMSEEIVEGVPA
ncbi:hypothetical protein NS506_02648 [Nocardia seriolae]|uniref:SseB protein N-terminal domain-containing protein n=1 Tax=Nocardia seriolae TaxID=37332 RepID=A0ABC8ARC1_9NOCA|nr:hypothetical protein [Nocardia seriolae]APA96710.1 hypothetical protein NS506_02648 [Nocardia seriolae]